MPFVLMAAVSVCVTLWLYRSQPHRASVVQGARDRVTRLRRGSPLDLSSTGDAPMSVRSDLVGIRGWLFVYVIGLGMQAFHGLVLTIGALIINTRPTLAGLNSFVPLPSLLVYVVSNLIVVLYTVALYVLMLKRRKSAIANKRHL
jgi:hypothetical protein